MLFSVCITYYYKRNNIEDLLFELNKYKSNDLEILIRNDNTKHKLNLKSNLRRVKIFNEKKKSLGEIESIKFLLSKSKGKYVTIISDDDLISHKILNDIKKSKFLKQSYIYRASTKLNNLNKKYKILKINKHYILKNFLLRKIHLSGTVGVFYSRNFLIKIINSINIKKYNFDTYLLFTAIFKGSYRFSNFIFGFNNISSSRISSKKINIRLYLLDIKNLINNFKNKLNKDLFYNFSKYNLENFYSIIFRKNVNYSFFDIKEINFFILRNNKSKFFKIYFLVFFKFLEYVLKLTYNFFKYLK